MNETSKSTIEFCLEFIKNNVDNASQRTMCRTWTATAIKVLKDDGPNSADYAISELEQVDDYLSGKNSKMTSVDVLTKLSTITQLI